MLCGGLRHPAVDCAWRLLAAGALLTYLSCTAQLKGVCCHASQIHRQFRKPLIVMSPKNLLRHPDCKSPLAEFDEVRCCLLAVTCIKICVLSCARHVAGHLQTVIVHTKPAVSCFQFDTCLSTVPQVPDDKGIIGVRFKRLMMDEGVTDRCVLHAFMHRF